MGTGIRNSQLNKTRGVLYHVFDSYEFVEECIYSLKTFKKFHPEIPATLFTNLAIKDAHKKYFENIVTINVILPRFVYKVFCLQQSLYDYTLYLDGDTEIRQSVHELFDFLDYYDFIFTRAIDFDFTKTPYQFKNYIDEKHCNAGIMLFKNSPAGNSFIDNWFDVSKSVEFERTVGEKTFMSYDDQMALNYLLRDVNYPQQINLRVLYLPGKIYNAVTYAFSRLKTDGQIPYIKIAHGHELFRQQLGNKISDKLNYLKKKYFAW